VRAAVFGAVLCLLAGCERAEHNATAPLTDTASVTLSARGMFSLQSDWERGLTIRTSTEELTVDLLSDTGWWRGSNLYLTDTGLMVLDEGQGGCLAVSLTPLHETRASGICDLLPLSASGENAPPLTYLGRFDEAPGTPSPILFLPAETTPERTLPDPI